MDIVKKLQSMKNKKISFPKKDDHILVATGQGTYHAKSVIINGPSILEVRDNDILLRTISSVDIYDQRLIPEDVVEEAKVEDVIEETAPAPKPPVKRRTTRAKKADG